MKGDIPRAVTTVAIWAAVAAIMTTIKFNGPSDMIVATFVGMTAFLSIGASASTFAIWRNAGPAVPNKGRQEEV